MIVEATLTDFIGEPAKKLHTTTGRNDQVLTVLWLRCSNVVDAFVERILELHICHDFYSSIYVTTIQSALTTTAYTKDNINMNPLEIPPMCLILALGMSANNVQWILAWSMTSFKCIQGAIFFGIGHVSQQRPGNLNYCSFAAIFLHDGSPRMSIHFIQMVTNMGIGAVVCHATVQALVGAIVVVDHLYVTRIDKQLPNNVVVILAITGHLW